MSLWLTIVAQLILHIILGRRSSLWSSIITATLHNRRPPVSIIIMWLSSCVVNAKGGRAQGDMAVVGRCYKGH